MAERIKSNFSDAIDILKENSVTSTKSIVERTSARITKGKIPVLVGSVPEAYTNFMLVDLEFEETHQRGIGPGILLDEFRVGEGNALRIGADLIRTLAILDQYPSKGFERRLSLVYGDALEWQRKWLETVKAPKIILDPRLGNPRELIRKLVGDVNFYTDVGLADVYKAVPLLRPHKDSSIDKRFAEVLNMDAGTFIGLRHQLVEAVHRKGLQTFGKDYIRKVNPDRRAQAFGIAISQIAVMQVDKNTTEFH